jgi:hypothetical protein
MEGFSLPRISLIITTERSYDEKARMLDIEIVDCWILEGPGISSMIHIALY